MTATCVRLPHRSARGCFLHTCVRRPRTEVQRSNCHPFQHDQWLFVHNGEINGFSAVRRDLALAVDPEYFGCITGTTDSEIMFYLALTFGMANDIAGGVSRMTAFVEDACRKRNIENAMQMSLGISDGESIYAFRYSTEGRSRSLFYSADVAAIRELAPGAKQLSADARAIVSEPLSDLAEAWHEVPESSFVTVSSGNVARADFAPVMP